MWIPRAKSIPGPGISPTAVSAPAGAPLLTVVRGPGAAVRGPRRPAQEPCRWGSEVDHMNDWKAIAVGGGVEIVYLTALAGLGPVAREAVWGSVLLLGVTGFIGGGVAGTLTAGTWRESARHGLLAGAVGGGYFAGLFWYLMMVLDAPVGAFWSLAYIIATNPLPAAFGATYGTLVVLTLAALGGLVIAAEGYLAGGATGQRSEPRISPE